MFCSRLCREGMRLSVLVARGRYARAAFFVDASADVAEAAVRVKEAAESQVGRPFQLEGLREALRSGFESPLCLELSMRCISCGTCTYVCPSCYCFNINDEIVEAAGERFRCWDNCFNPMYTLETSGHNPREAKHARFRNRFSHKFWYYPDKYDSLLCTGCGAASCLSHPYRHTRGFADHGAGQGGQMNEKRRRLTFADVEPGCQSHARAPGGQPLPAGNGHGAQDHRGDAQHQVVPGAFR